MTRVRSLCAIALCLLLGLTGQAMAFARAAAPADGRAVICTGSVYQSVYVDAEGQPTAPPELCADCLHLLAGLLPAHAPLAAPGDFGTAAAVPAPLAVHSGTSVRNTRARAPPLPV